MACLVTACRGLDLHTRVLLEVERNVGAGGDQASAKRDRYSLVLGLTSRYGYFVRSRPHGEERSRCLQSNRWWETRHGESNQQGWGMPILDLG
ncbi:hypothetical protein CLIM01_05356 [Colletotrichum limetticola]|uniref:Uncharacterized protein n=1 Tax=Colletotrichum limetticola TaxID=1209924 RepID=A0ABQ9Q0E0_9PEZI|nr:hypothetical protein CLIM01_05356 [Colletotrichum limetticola]